MFVVFVFKSVVGCDQFAFWQLCQLKSVSFTIHPLLTSISHLGQSVYTDLRILVRCDIPVLSTFWMLHLRDLGKKKKELFIPGACGVEHKP